MTDMPHDDFDIPSEDTPFRELWSKTPDQLAVILATPYDPTIQSLLGALKALTTFGDADFHTLLSEAKTLCESTFDLPSSPTLGDMREHQKASDLIVLGMLTHEWATRGDQITNNWGTI